MPEDPKVLLPSLNEYRDNIHKIIQVGKALSVKLIFLTQPMLFDDTPYYRGIEGKFNWINTSKYTLSAASYWKLLNIYNQELMKICSEQGVECFDLASVVPHSNLYFYDAVHFNERGAELVTQKLTEFLINARILNFNVENGISK